MNGYLFIATAALLALASCSQDNDITQNSVQSQEATPIAFGTYTSQATRSASSSVTGEINAASGFQTVGFGVFAYYQDTYNSSIAPNFMNNEKVYGNPWNYDNIKYWPNGYGKADASGATGSGSNKLSFFAYAPYFDGETYDAGITAIATTTDPVITYKYDSSNFIDLLWGTAGNNTISKVGTSDTQAGSTYNGSHYKVWTDLTKPAATDKVKFNFVHALAKFGGGTGEATSGIYIKANPNQGSVDGTNTKITVSSITIKQADGAATTEKFYNEGTFNLATGSWTATTAGSTSSLTTQTFGTSELNTKIQAPASIDKDKFFDSSDANYIPGVTNTASISAFADGQGMSSVLFIPGSSPKINVSVTYKVYTKDDKLANGYTEVEQTVSKDVTITTNASAVNKAYGLLIKLGLTKVEFDVDATVKDWTPVTSADDIENSVELPKND